MGISAPLDLAESNKIEKIAADFPVSWLETGSQVTSCTATRLPTDKKEAPSHTGSPFQVGARLPSGTPTSGKIIAET